MDLSTSNITSDCCRHVGCVGAVVVSYLPDPAVLMRVLFALVPQVSRIFLVDNGSGEKVTAELATFLAGHNIELVSLSSNLGIAAAQNIGIRCVAELGLEFVILLDQDSIAASDMVDVLVESYRSLSCEGITPAAVGPATVDQRTGTLGKFARIRNGLVSQVSCSAVDNFVEADFLVSSGSLISLAVLEKLGEMNEGYFIDHVDTEWCLRARAQGLKLYGVCRARLLHTLGDKVLRVWFGRWREVAVHSPLRDYFMCRNTILMLRNPFMVGSWRIALLVRLAMFMVFFGFGVSPRNRRLKMMFKGLLHGFRGRVGSL
jgi:rhamnosyltransferase